VPRKILVREIKNNYNVTLLGNIASKICSMNIALAKAEIMYAIELDYNQFQFSVVCTSA